MKHILFLLLSHIATWIGLGFANYEQNTEEQVSSRIEATNPSVIKKILVVAVDLGTSKHDGTCTEANLNALLNREPDGLIHFYPRLSHYSLSFQITTVRLQNPAAIDETLACTSQSQPIYQEVSKLLMNERGIDINNFDLSLILRPRSDGCWRSSAGNKIAVIFGCASQDSLHAMQHELGHLLNMGHSGISGDEYGDESDVMGGRLANDPILRLNAAHLAFKSWIRPEEDYVARRNGSFQIKPLYDSNLNLPRVVRYQRYKKSDMYLSYRTASGMDAPLRSFDANRLHAHSLLGGYSIRENRLLLGDTFLDEYSGVQITFQEDKSTGEKVFSLDADCSTRGARMHLAEENKRYLSAGPNSRGYFIVDNGFMHSICGSQKVYGRCLSTDGLFVNTFPPAVSPSNLPTAPQLVTIDVPVAASEGKKTLRCETSTSPNFDSSNGINIDFWIDSTPPSTPTNLAISTNYLGRKILSWKAPGDNVAVEKYDVYKSGRLISTVMAPRTAQLLLESAPELSQFQVRAIDFAGNMSN